MFEWECPSWGCRGVLLTEEQPHYGRSSNAFRLRGYRRREPVVAPCGGRSRTSDGLPYRTGDGLILRCTARHQADFEAPGGHPAYGVVNKSRGGGPLEHLGGCLRSYPPAPAVAPDAPATSYTGARPRTLMARSRLGSSTLPTLSRLPKSRRVRAMMISVRAAGEARNHHTEPG